MRRLASRKGVDTVVLLCPVICSIAPLLSEAVIFVSGAFSKKSSNNSGKTWGLPDGFWEIVLESRELDYLNEFERLST